MHVHKTIGPFGTYASGLIISIVVGVAAGDLMTAFFLWTSGLSKDWSYVSFWPIALPVAAEFFSVGRGANVPTGWLGVPTFLGKRLDKFFGLKHIVIPFLGVFSLILSEGSHWQFPKLMSFIPVNHKKQTSGFIPVQGYSSDGIEMSGLMFYKYQVTRPFVYLDADGELMSLEQIGMARFRDCIANSTAAVLTSSEIKSDIAENIDGLMKSVSEADYGVGILEVFVPSIRLPAELEAALTKKRIQEVNREAEKIMMDAFLDRMADLKAGGITDPVRAAEILQNERNTIKSEVRTYRVEDAEAIANAFAAALAQVFGRK